MRNNLIAFILGVLLTLFVLLFFDKSESVRFKDQIARISQQRDSLEVLAKISRLRQRKTQDSLYIYKESDKALRHLAEAQNKKISQYKQREQTREAEIAKIQDLPDDSIEVAYQRRYSVPFRPALKFGFQDLVRYDSLKEYAKVLEWHVDTLNLQVSNLYQIERLQASQIDELTFQVDTFGQLQELDRAEIKFLKKKNRKTKRKSLLTGIAVGIAVSSLISQF